MEGVKEEKTNKPLAYNKFYNKFLDEENGDEMKSKTLIFLPLSN